MSTRQLFDHVFWPDAIIATSVFGLVLLLLGFALVRYRAGRGHEPSHKSEHKVAEPVFGVVLVGIAAFLAVYVGIANASERSSLGPPRLRVTITAFQWCWSFHYASTPVTVTSNCVGSLPTLVVPTHEIIGFRLTSADVVHEWWLPASRWKEEAFPGHYNSFELRFDTSGTWQGRCDEFCGLYHDRMDFRVHAESLASFRRWLTARERAAGRST